MLEDTLIIIKFSCICTSANFHYYYRYWYIYYMDLAEWASTYS